MTLQPFTSIDAIIFYTKHNNHDELEIALNKLLQFIHLHPILTTEHTSYYGLTYYHLYIPYRQYIGHISKQQVKTKNGYEYRLKIKIIGINDGVHITRYLDLLNIIKDLTIVLKPIEIQELDIAIDIPIPMNQIKVIMNDAYARKSKSNDYKNSIYLQEMTSRSQYRPIIYDKGEKIREKLNIDLPYPLTRIEMKYRSRFWKKMNNITELEQRLMKPWKRWVFITGDIIEKIDGDQQHNQIYPDLWQICKWIESLNNIENQIYK